MTTSCLLNNAKTHCQWISAFVRKSCHVPILLPLCQAHIVDQFFPPHEHAAQSLPNLPFKNATHRSSVTFPFGVLHYIIHHCINSKGAQSCNASKGAHCCMDRLGCTTCSHAARTDGQILHQLQMDKCATSYRWCKVQATETISKIHIIILSFVVMMCALSKSETESAASE